MPGIRSGATRAAASGAGGEGDIDALDQIAERGIEAVARLRKGTLISSMMWPGLRENTRMRSHMRTASSMLCVTRITPLIGSLPSIHRSRKSVRKVSAVSTSSAENGSSIEQNVRMHDQRAGKADALAHAARQLARKGRLVAVQADQVDGGQRTLADLAPRAGRALPSPARHSPARSARETARRSGTPSRCRVRAR